MQDTQGASHATYKGKKKIIDEGNIEELINHLIILRILQQSMPKIGI